MDSLPTNLETEAFVVMKPGDDFKLTPIILDEVRDDELLIEMKYSGICHTVCISLSRSLATAVTSGLMLLL
jgi:Zn-dependent alcohol dehydrogenase